MSRSAVVFLVGFMGSGKTSVGRALAGQLGLAFIDLDEQIARHVGKGIPVIFAEDGEAGFRAHERAALLALEPGLDAGAVIATGGGTCEDAVACAWMRTHGRMVWLDVPLETIERRVSRDGSRPLFGDRVALDALYQERRSGYASAELRVDAGALAPEDVARLVVRGLDEGKRA